MAHRQHDCYQDHDHENQFDASSCDHQFVEKLQEEIAALKAEVEKCKTLCYDTVSEMVDLKYSLRSVVGAAKAVRRYRVTPSYEWLALDEALSLPGVVKVMEENSPPCPHNISSGTKYI